MNPSPNSEASNLKCVAIVGISAELPSGQYADHNLDHESFFRFLLAKGEAYQTIPEDRFNVHSWKGPGLGQVITDTGAFLKNISLFDHVEFGISAKDARSMSVSTRKLIELSFLALLDSGIHYRGQRVGCYTSGIPFDILTVADPDVYEARGSFAGGPCMIANKISYHLDLLGPSIPTDTAFQALRSGDCEAAVVGGCQLNHRFIDFIQYSQGGVLSPEGKCKPFDASADGFSRGEGAVVIVVKILEDAIRDGDHIYASILGTALTSNGSAAPANAPVGAAQAEAMRQAYSGTGRSPKEVDFVELHATGTAAGDPVEANWTGREFQREDEVIIGSVKGNIGHLEIAAFLASLSKICSSFAHGIIPPNVNLVTPNPAIKWDQYKLRVPLHPMVFIPRHPSGRALVSMMSSGIGGVNGHAVIEGPPQQQDQNGSAKMATEVPFLLVAAGLSPRSTSSISTTIELSVSTSNTDLAALSTIYGRRARQMTWRSFSIINPDRSILVPFSQPVFNQRVRSPLVFVFSGQGPQHLAMGKELYRALPAFRESIDRLDLVHVQRTGQSLLETTGIFSGQSPAEQLPDIWPISVTLPALAMLQVALCDVLKSIGIVPDVVIGHSAGETALSYVCGAAEDEMVMELAIARGQAMASAKEGAMAAVSCTITEARDLIKEVQILDPSGILEIACLNSADSFTIAGDDHLVDQAVETAQTHGYFARKLRTRVGVHSSLMESCKAEYLSLVAKVFDRFPDHTRPHIPVFSTFTGEAYNDRFSAEYFWNQTRSPVRFSDALSSLQYQYPKSVFLEISPHPALVSYISSGSPDSTLVLCPMRRVKKPSAHHEMQTYLETLGQLIVQGSNLVDFRALNGIQAVPHDIPVADYPFQRKDVPYYPETSATVKQQMASRNGPLNSPFLHISTQTHQTISQHVIQGEPIMPAAGFLEMAFEFGCWSLWNVTFHSMLSLPSEKVTAVDVTSEGLYWSVRSRPAGANSSTSRLHADGYMSSAGPQDAPPPLDLEILQGRLKSRSISRFYSTLSYFAQYGPMFQRVEAWWLGDDEALVRVRGASEDLPDSYQYIIHPAILDACLHVMVHPTFTGNADRNIYYLPSRVHLVTRYAGCIAGSLPEVVFAHATFKEWRPDCLVLDVSVMDDSGNPLCTMSGFEVAAHQIAPDWTADKPRFQLLNQPYSISTFIPFETETDFTHHPRAPAVFDIFSQFYDHVTNGAGKRVIRVLHLGEDELTIAKSVDLTSRDRDHHCRHIVTFSGMNLFSKDVQIVKFDSSLPADDQGLGPAMFDIVTGHLSGTNPQEPSIIVSLSRLLVPGGALILKLPSYDGFLGDESSLSYRMIGTVLFLQTHPLQLLDLAGLQEEQTPSIINFRSGKELDIQKRVMVLDGTETLWITSTLGFDGAAAQGFSRSLRKELTRSIRLVLFNPSWTISDRTGMISQLSHWRPLEDELIIDADRNILVPRLCPAPPPSANSLNLLDYWVYHPDTSNVILGAIPVVPEQHILIQITATSKLDDSLYAIWGEVLNSQSSSWVEGQQVIGISEGPLSSHHLGFAGNFTELPSTANETALLPKLGGIIVALLGIGVESLCRPQRLQGNRVLVTNTDEVIGRTLATFLTLLGIQVQEMAGELSISDLEDIQSADLIFSGSIGTQRHLVSRVAKKARIIHWHDEERGIRALIHSKTWTIFDKLPTLIRFYWTTFASMISSETPQDPRDLIPPNSVVLRHRLFDPSAVYLLVGGIGSLGIHTALWMYNKGARKMVLTSRSGRNSLVNQKNTIALRILSHLETLPDLDLRLVACDASSAADTTACIASIHSTIRGVMLLSVQLSDRTFVSHCQQTYDIPFYAKQGALFALEKALCIDKLDFLISMSSATIFGNAGQTNYASANTILDEHVRRYANGISIVAPAIIDSSTIARTEDLLTDLRLAHWAPWAMSSKDVCNCIEDALNMLQIGPVGIYVPDYDWPKMQKHFGPSPIYDHLVSHPVEADALNDSHSLESIHETVLKFLDVDPSDFDKSVPFTSYGLDSLSAGRLSRALKPFVSLTQLQLLADMSLDDVHSRIDAMLAARDITAPEVVPLGM
ncbi:hypothetical protein C8J56DRAFT_1055239 [Mycena floridula]|nr:hypothetical protein C8J56DRAFT_1055239 [Mycena floridula]